MTDLSKFYLKAFILDINDGRETASIDRLKTVFLDATPELTFPLTIGSTPTTTTPVPPQAACSERHIHFPARYL